MDFYNFYPIIIIVIYIVLLMILSNVKNIIVDDRNSNWSTKRTDPTSEFVGIKTWTRKQELKKVVRSRWGMVDVGSPSLNDSRKSREIN